MSSRLAGESRCMKAVARMTPEPKYLAMKRLAFGIRDLGARASIMGSSTPSRDPTRMMNTEAIRRDMSASLASHPEHLGISSSSRARTDPLLDGTMAGRFDGISLVEGYREIME